MGCSSLGLVGREGGSREGPREVGCGPDGWAKERGGVRLHVPAIFERGMGFQNPAMHK